jgi:hypothetical protein
MALELGKKSLNMAKSLGGAIGRGIAWNYNLGGDKRSPDKLLGQIYKTMLKVQEEQDIDHELAMRDEKKKEKNEAERNAALIKALTVRKKPRAKKPPKKKEEEVKKEKPAEQKPTEKKTEQKPAEKKTEQKPAEKKTEQKPAEQKPAEKKPEQKQEQKKQEKQEKKQEQKKEEVKKEEKKQEQKKEEVKKEEKKTEQKQEKKDTAQKEQRKQEQKKEEKKVEQVKKKEPEPKTEPVPKKAEIKPPPSAEKAGKIGVGAAMATTAALFGREALATNIAKYESKSSSGKSFGGNEYNAYNKGTDGNKIVAADKPIDFSKMSIAEYLRRGELPQGDPNRLFAVGRYQIIPKTMKGLVKNLKLDPKTTYLDAATQDLLFSKGLTTSVQGRGAVEDYINGKKGATRDAAIMALAKEFASVGVPYDTERIEPEHKDKKTGKIIPEKKIPIAKGQSYYSGVGGNKAHNPPEAVGEALDADRAAKLKQNTSNVTPPANTGPRIDQSSKENADLNANLTKQQSTTVNNINTSSTQSSAPTQEQPKVDDSSPMHRKIRGR